MEVGPCRRGGVLAASGSSLPDQDSKQSYSLQLWTSSSALDPLGFGDPFMSIQRVDYFFVKGGKPVRIMDIYMISS